MAEEKQPGPEPKRLKLPGDWKERLKEALQKKKPEGGWPKRGQGDQAGQSKGGGETE